MKQCQTTVESTVGGSVEGCGRDRLKSNAPNTLLSSVTVLTALDRRPLQRGIPPKPYSGVFV